MLTRKDWERIHAAAAERDRRCSMKRKEYWYVWSFRLDDDEITGSTQQCDYADRMQAWLRSTNDDGTGDEK